MKLQHSAQFDLLIKKLVVDPPQFSFTHNSHRKEVMKKTNLSIHLFQRLQYHLLTVYRIKTEIGDLAAIDVVYGTQNSAPLARHSCDEMRSVTIAVMNAYQYIQP